ncbi:hypothetical protein MSG28_002230 [Choristoneura fumiferana]|uniref:Uncharacterized protein n=1 Tax=Choristoneura fumiferana TaxID=7141 RepID=A0ACC0JV13_CHOFU|nr:hypothetical protein MSG28_002230 [Choristoneura fumiferana]
MFTWIWIFEIVLCSAVAQFPAEEPTGGYENITSCEEFERDAHFHPHEVVDSMWGIFYFWADNTEMTPIVFSLLSAKRLRKLRAVINAIDPYLGVEWHRASLLMEPRAGLRILLLHQDTPGAYRALIMKEQRDKARPHPKPWISFADVRMKQVGRIIGMMSCERLTAYALARLQEMPVTEADCVAAANLLGYQAPDGKSYLYVKSLQKTDL